MTISAVKPVENPRWATNGGTRLTPTVGQQDTGWTNGQRPPFNVMNWLQGLIYDWQQYLEDATDELESTKLNRNGSGANGVINGVVLPDVNGRAFGSVALGYDLFGRNLSLSGSVTTNVNPDAPNARNLGNGTNYWDNFFTDTARIRSDVTPFTATTATIGSLSLPFLAMYADVFKPQLNPAAGAAQFNNLTAKNTPKAWGIFQTDGVGGVTLLNGFNCSAAINVSGVQVTFAQNMANANYAIMLSNHTSGVAAPDQAWVPGSTRTVSGFLVNATRENAGGNENFLNSATNVVQTSFVVFGEQ